MSITIVHEMKLRYLHRKLFFLYHCYWPDTREFIILYTDIDQTLVNSLYCIQTLTRHLWIHYTYCWIVK